MFRLLSTPAAELVFAGGLAWDVILPYFSGAAILVIGIITFIKKGSVRTPGLGTMIGLGPVFLAASMAVFGVEHFTIPKVIAGMVPAWIPGHLFWAYFAGVCILSATLSIAARKFAGLAAALLGLMLLLFAVLIHIPAVGRHPRIQIVWVVALRDLVFSGGALSVAVSYGEAWRPQVRQRLLLVARLFIAVPIVLLGVEHFLLPENAPGVTLEKMTPPWLPAHLLWAYLTGAIYVVTGLCMLVNRHTRLAAAWLGVWIVLLVLVIYVPIMAMNPTDIEGLNYVADTLLLGASALALAGAQDENDPLRLKNDMITPGKSVGQGTAISGS